MFKRSILFFTEDLWNFRLSELSGWRKSGFRWLRIAVLSVRGFITDKCTIRASSLTYYTLMSIVPILAMLFAIARGVGYQDTFRTELLLKFQEQKTAVLEVISFADRLLEQTHGGWIAAAGLIVLFWSATSLLSSIEETLNRIWNVRQRRWRRIVSSYFVFLLIAPFFFILSSSGIVYFTKHIDEIIHQLPLGEKTISSLSFLIRLFPYLLSWFFFSFIYYFLPNIRVFFRSAAVGGLVAGVLYVLTQWGYVYFQIGLNRYGAVYGSFAALPLFLVWLQLSWFILLFGAEVSYAHQTLLSHEFEPAVKRASLFLRKKMMLWIMQLAAIQFQLEKIPLTLKTLTSKYKIPLSLATRLLADLVAYDLLHEVKQNGYVPTKPVEKLTVSDVLKAIEEEGVSHFPFLQSKELDRFEEILHNFSSLIEQSEDNRTLVEIPRGPSPL